MIFKSYSMLLPTNLRMLMVQNVIKKPYCPPAERLIAKLR